MQDLCEQAIMLPQNRISSNGNRKQCFNIIGQRPKPRGQGKINSFMFRRFNKATNYARRVTENLALIAFKELATKADQLTISSNNTEQGVMNSVNHHCFLLCGLTPASMP